MNPEWLAPLGNFATIFLAVVLTPAILFLLKVVWDIKTNDLPHIYRELQKLNGKHEED